jgi:hypothetical protein
MNLPTELVIIARLLREKGYEYLADCAAQAAKVLAGPTCIDCGGSVLGGRSVRCASCRHSHRVRYHRQRYLAKCGKGKAA